ncbi:MAG: CBS domain-containing protein, partial [Pseudomonadota bacterium]
MSSENKRPGNRLMDRPEYTSKKPPLTCAADTSVLEAVSSMTAENFGSIIVVSDDRKVIGLATERDVMTKLVAKQLDPTATTIADIMTKDPRTARE